MALTLGAGCPTDMTVVGNGAAGSPSQMGFEGGIVNVSGSVISGSNVIASSSGSFGGTVEAAYLRVTANSAPADSSLDAGEVAMWFDKTDGAAKLMFKAKQANGTVKTGSVAVAT